MLTVVVSIVSVMLVVAAAGLMTRFSKLPPVAPVMVLLTLPASRYTSSVGAARLMLPVLLPAAMVMTCPPVSYTHLTLPTIYSV